MAKFKLKDLSRSKLEYGSGSAACAFDGNVRYVRITDITDDGNLASDIVSPSYYEEKHVLQDGDILFARTGATVGKTFLYRNKYGKCVYAGFLIRMVPDRSIVLPDYIYYFTKSPRYRDFVAANMKVVAQPNINAKQYGDLEIDVPSFKEQQSIVDKLVKIDELIALRKEQLAKLDQLVKSRFIELFDGKHETKPLQAVCEELFAGGDVKKDKSSDTQSEEYPYPIYTNGEKDNGLYGYTSIVRVAKEAVTISGRGTIGFTCLRKEPFYPAVRLIVAVPKQELVNGCYLQHFIQSKNYGGQGASIPQLTVPMIKDEPIPVPPMELQKQFTAFVEETDKSKLAIQQSLDKLELLRKSLMQEYFG